MQAVVTQPTSVELIVILKWSIDEVTCGVHLPFTLSQTGQGDDIAYTVGRVFTSGESRFAQGDCICRTDKDNFESDKTAHRLAISSERKETVAFRKVFHFHTREQGLAFPQIVEKEQGYCFTNWETPGNFAHQLGIGPDDLLVLVNNLRVGSSYMSMAGGLEPWLLASQQPIRLCIMCKERPIFRTGGTPQTPRGIVRKRTHESATSPSKLSETASGISNTASQGIGTDSVLDRSPKRQAQDASAAEGDLGPDGLLVAEQTVSLSCPVTLTRLRRPVRGAECTHPRAVELEFCQRGQKCPLCGKLVTTVVKDMDLQSLLASTPEKVMQASVTYDGSKFTFRPVVPAGISASAILDVDGDAASDAPLSPRDSFIDTLVTSILSVPAPGASSDTSSIKENLPQPAAPPQSVAQAASKREAPVIKRESSSLGVTAEGKLGASDQPQSLHAILSRFSNEDLNAAEKLAMTISELSIQETKVIGRGMGAEFAHRARWPPCRLVEAKAKKRIFIGGVEILFPHRKPLVPQTRVMVEMIACLKSKSHALLESPTGTGKTAATLSAALSWQRYHDMRGWADFSGTPRTIYYLTRTHSQATQVVAALRGMPYRPMIVTLASRVNLCSNQAVMTEAEGSNEGLSACCSQAVKAGTCLPFKQLLKYNVVDHLYKLTRTKIAATEDDGLFDIEDLRSFGPSAQDHGCPFFASKALHPSAQLVICPYNYVIDPDIRSVVIPNANEGSSVFIFDEGHNLESSCLETGSCTLRLPTVLEIVKDLCVLSSFSDWIAEENMPVRSLALEVMLVFDKIAQFLLNQRAGWIRTSESDRVTKEEKTRELYKRGGIASSTGTALASMVFRDIGLSEATLSNAEEALAKILRALADLGHVNPDDVTAYDARPRQLRSLAMTGAKSLRVLSMMKKIPQDFYAVVNATRIDAAADLVHNFHRDFNEPSHRPARTCSRTHGTYLNQNVGEVEWTVELRLMLMNPGAVFNDVASIAHSVIVASGTLFPMNSHEFGKAFHERLRVKDRQIALDHVIKLEQQLYMSVIPRSPTGDLLDGSYRSRQQLGPFRYEAALFETIRVVLRDAVSVQGGSLVFVSSFKQLTDLENFMQQNHFVARLQAERGPVIFENTSVEDLEDAASDFDEDSDDGGNEYNEDEEDDSGYDGWPWGNARSRHQQQRQRNGGWNRGQRKGHPRRRTGKPKSAFELAKARFRGAVDAGQSPVLFAVFRGRMSEGIDFKDNYCRAVFLVGIPYPALFDSAIKYKRAWNDSKHAAGESYVRGGEWYSQQAFRAMNQALGRVIRHKNDFGAVFFVDARLDDVNMHRHLARWCRGAIKRDFFPRLVPRVRTFFDQVPEHLKNPAAAAELAAATPLSSSQNSQDSFLSLGSAPPSSSNQTSSTSSSLSSSLSSSAT
ncbi:Regulator of telomere elongation helicase 1 [Hondaea fermentalgiana]|uniref:Regulator of telomere elongation helicase 1 n=1 Tax=Hondaea fermentalgiana TaxID=2315210 RepID=A0A2R5GID8_9STRA|nr:Regulator of telomere elongation helicase 1 [Hondaea fermentalgiana]|eukprot:GBG30660.1 Regulator of telomere elongation helicase 1 [Hondaea fermentalgiana]